MEVLRMHEPDCAVDCVVVLKVEREGAIFVYGTWTGAREERLGSVRAFPWNLGPTLDQPALEHALLRENAFMSTQDYSISHARNLIGR